MLEKQFESICGSPLWNHKTVYSDRPDFTQCFHNTILKWSPCALLWVVTPLWIYMLTKEPVIRIKISWILVAKNITTLALIAVEVLNLLNAINNNREDVYYMSPMILTATYILVLFLIHLERKRGLKSSTLLFVFWCFMALTNALTLRSKIIHFYHKTHDHDFVDMWLFFVFYALVIVNIILSSFTEKNITKIGGDEEADELDQSFEIDGKPPLKMMPENSVSLFSRLCFWWINDLILTGYKRPLTRDDMWKIEESESSRYLTQKLQVAWDRASRGYIQSLKSINEEAEAEDKAKTASNRKEATKTRSQEEEAKLTDSTVEVTFRDGKKLKKPSFGWCLCRVFGGKFLAGSFIKVIQDLLIFIGPILLDKLISFFKDPNQNIHVGFFYTALLFLSSLIQSFVLQHYFHRMFIVGSRIRTSIIGCVYNKSLRLSASARKKAEVGTLTNLMAVNAQMLADLTVYLNIIWSAPFQIIICLIMLWSYLGVSAIIGLSTIIFLMPVSVYVGNKTKKIQLVKQGHTDNRIKMMNEILSGIKIIKFYGWELSFKDIIGKIRSKEMDYLKKMGMLSISSTFLWICAPLIITIVSFGSFISLNGSEKFTANVVFVSLSLFNIMRFPLTVLPNIISSMIAAKVSLVRVSTFLLREEINETDISHEDIPDVAVSVTNVDLGWSKQTPYFKSLNLEVKKGKLVAIVGPVGSGKSSMLSSFLGEMYKLNHGRINLNGSVAYVPQLAWIQNETVKNNILFGTRFDQALYEDVLRACSLTTDLAIMPAGDKTEIGEKGINLSGGQKQRISLARAVYSNADIYMLDDPLSAVDSHVGKHIFDNVIGPNGILRNKTRLFVTNSLSFLPQVDEVLMLDEGVIKEAGPYNELKQKNGLFSDFIKNFLATNEANKDNDKNDENDKPEDGKPTETKKENGEKNGPIRRDNNEKEKTGEKITATEKVESGNVKMSVLMEYFKSCRYYAVVIFMVLFLLSNIASVGSNYWLNIWSSKSGDPVDGERNKFFYFGVFVIIGGLQCVFTLASDFVFLMMCYFAAKILHDNMLFSILRSTMEFFESTPSGRIINRFSKDIEATERGIPESFKSLCRCLFHVLFTVLVILLSTPLFIVAFVPMIVVYIFVQRYFVASMRQLKRMDSVSKSPIFSHFGETVNGVSTIRAYNAQGRFIRLMEKHVDENLLFYFPNNISNRWLALRLELIGNLIAVFAALFAVLSKDSISASMAGLSISYALNVSQTLNWLVRMSADFETNITSVERIKEYFNTPHEDEWRIESTKPGKSWPDNGNISFNNYSVKYREGLDDVLKNITIEIMPSEKIGIVGRTGAGKSSLTLALFRILKHSRGTINIDGVDIKVIGLHDLRHKITIIPQDPVIFSGTIRMNLDPFGEYSDEQIWRSLELAHLKDFIMSKEKKLEFDCPQGGGNLSVGQRQLICLARALLRKTKILILDEATASIDHNTDDLIQQTIRSEFKDCTVLTIAHRLNTILDSTRILVLDRGQILEFDKPENLLRNKQSLFYSMASHAGLV